MAIQAQGSLATPGEEAPETYLTLIVALLVLTVAVLLESNV